MTFSFLAKEKESVANKYTTTARVSTTSWELGLNKTKFAWTVTRENNTNCKQKSQIGTSTTSDALILLIAADSVTARPSETNGQYGCYGELPACTPPSASSQATRHARAVVQTPNITFANS